MTPTVTMTSQRLALLFALALAACGTPQEISQLSSALHGHCSYQGRFSGVPECKEFRGEWSDADARAACDKLNGIFEANGCEAEGQGSCEITKTPAHERVILVNTNPNDCGSSKLGCEVFAGGRFVPSELCGGQASEIAVVENAFPKSRKVCKPAKEGEAPGKGPNGEVCTWESMQGATEEGRLFTDYASCDTPMKQRPYRPVEPNERYNTPDPRLEDPEYKAEHDWVLSQARAQSCMCCHSSVPGDGAAVFSIDRPGSFPNQFNDRGLAQAAGWLSTVELGALPPEDNNGFEAPTPENPHRSAFRSTDQARMMRFFEKELEHRGFAKADFEGLPSGLGPLSEQYDFRPGNCTADERIDADGTIRWVGGKARYVYVLEAEAQSPTVPPNLDRPAGTLWRVDVPETGLPLASGTVTYGVLPAGTEQAIPADSAAPTALVSGRTYYLYVTADVLLPLTRCLFVAP